MNHLDFSDIFKNPNIGTTDIECPNCNAVFTHDDCIGDEYNVDVTCGYCCTTFNLEIFLKEKK
mgnify:CR=1 FL=1